MMIEVNKRKVKNGCKGLAALLIVVGLFAGYGVMNPSSDLTEEKVERTAGLSEETNWGLSFPTEGQPPVGNVSQDQLSAYQAFYLGDTSEKTLYLTFDAGYENGYTSEILDTLKKEKVNATFFLVGTYMETNRDLVKRMSEEGHIVANHTMHHPDMSAIENQEDFAKELKDVEVLYKEITGEDMVKLYRPPKGIFSQKNLEMAKAMDYRTIFWSLAYVDWYENQQPTREQALAKLMPRMHNGAIVLLHSTSKTNAQILGELIQKWKDEGYQFGSLEQLGR